VEAGDFEEAADGRGEIAEDEATALETLFLPGLHGDAKAGAGDVFDAGAVDCDGTAGEKREKRGAEFFGAGVIDFSDEGDYGLGADGGGGDGHECERRIEALR
jgi:hypothetical protein